MTDDEEMTGDEMAWRMRLTIGLLLTIALLVLVQQMTKPGPNFVSQNTICPDGAGPIQYGEATPYPGDAFPSYVCP